MKCNKLDDKTFEQISGMVAMILDPRIVEDAYNKAKANPSDTFKLLTYLRDKTHVIIEDYNKTGNYPPTNDITLFAESLARLEAMRELFENSPIEAPPVNKQKKERIPFEHRHWLIQLIISEKWFIIIGIIVGISLYIQNIVPNLFFSLLATTFFAFAPWATTKALLMSAPMVGVTTWLLRFHGEPVINFINRIISPFGGNLSTAMAEGNVFTIFFWIWLIGFIFCIYIFRNSYREKLDSKYRVSDKTLKRRENMKEVAHVAGVIGAACIFNKMANSKERRRQEAEQHAAMQQASAKEYNEWCEQRRKNYYYDKSRVNRGEKPIYNPGMKPDVKIYK